MAEPLGASAPIAAAGGLDHRSPSDTQTAAVTPQHDGSSRNAPQPAPSTEFHLGTTVEAIVRAPATPGTPGALVVGTRLLLRIVALPSSPEPEFLIGRVVDSGGPETLVATPLGLLALQRRLTLAPDTAIALQRLEEIPLVVEAEDTPSRAGGWPALDEAIAVLTQAAPELAAGLRAELSPSSGLQLAGTLLFLLGTLYQGVWPGRGVDAALTAANHGKLAQRLSDDADELRRLGTDPATGDWRVLALPLLAGMSVLPLRLFLRRPKPDAAPEAAIRFAIEVEPSQLGPLQLDGLLRGNHLILVVRSHRSLARDLRADASVICRDALQRWGMSGDLSFATVGEFALTPLAGLRQHIKIVI
jgi:hypothetical protein